MHWPGHATLSNHITVIIYCFSGIVPKRSLLILVINNNYRIVAEHHFFLVVQCLI